MSKRLLGVGDFTPENGTDLHVDIHHEIEDACDFLKENNTVAILQTDSGIEIVPVSSVEATTGEETHTTDVELSRESAKSIKNIIREKQVGEYAEDRGVPEKEVLNEATNGEFSERVAIHETLQKLLERGEIYDPTGQGNCYRVV